MRTAAQLINHIHQIEIEEMKHQAARDATPPSARATMAEAQALAQRQQQQVSASSESSQVRRRIRAVSEGTQSAQNILRQTLLTKDHLLLTPPPIFTHRIAPLHAAIRASNPKPSSTGNMYTIDRTGEGLRLVDTSAMPKADKRAHFVAGQTHTQTPAEYQSAQATKAYRQDKAAGQNPRQEDFKPKFVMLGALGVALLIGCVLAITHYAPNIGHGF